MPTVPVIQDSVQLQTQTGRRGVRATPDAFGAAEAQALGSVAQGLGVVANVAADKEDEYAEAQALEADNELQRRLRDRLYNTESGYLSTARGGNATKQRGVVEGDLDALAEEVGSTLAENPNAMARFRNRASQRLASAYGDVAVHAANQNAVYLNEQSEAAIEEEISGAVASFADPAVVAAHISRATGQLEVLRQRNGWGEDTMRARTRALQSDINQRVILSMSVSDPQGAMEYYSRIRPSLSAEEAGELLTTMRAAQAQAVEEVEGMAWQAFANGQPLSAMGAEAYQRFTTDPLFGAAHARVRDAYRVRAESASGGVRAQDNSPNYWALRALSMSDPDSFQEMLPQFLADPQAAGISRGDVGRLLERQIEIRQGGGANGQAAVFNAVRNVAEPMVGRYGLDLSPSDAQNNTAAQTARNRAAAFDAALAEVVSGFVEQNRGRQPSPEETQVLIGQAIIKMRDADVRGMGRGTQTYGFAVRGVRGREGVADTEAVVPRGLIPAAQAERIRRRLSAIRNGSVTQGEIEAEYTRVLRGQRTTVPFAEIPTETRTRIVQRLQAQNPGAVVTQGQVVEAYANILERQ